MNTIDLVHLKADLKRVIADAEQVLQSAAGTADHSVDALRSRALQQMQQARERIDEVQSRAAATLRRAAHSGHDYAHAHPWRVAAYAGAAAALLAGWLLSRR